MNLLETILSNPDLVKQVAAGAGLGARDAQTGIEALLPGLARGLQRNAAKPGGLEALTGAVQSGKHDRYFDSPGSLGEVSARDEGNSILGHILGSKDVSRNLAGRAAEQSGLSAGILKKMLPMVAAMAMGALNKQSQGGANFDALTSGLRPSGAGTGSSAKLGGLAGFLDADGDGSALDDVLNLAKKFL